MNPHSERRLPEDSRRRSARAVAMSAMCDTAVAPRGPVLTGLRYTNAMARKRALVVDDSKSARVILSRMLEKYDIEVDMAESAEQAIEYLKSNRPDAIFMDHLMPGMDGLQAVQAIKGNPQTAMIPIMMYTSQEGELYVGQARALGAHGRAAEAGAARRCVEGIVRAALAAGPARHERTRAARRWNSTPATPVERPHAGAARGRRPAIGAGASNRRSRIRRSTSAASSSRASTASPSRIVSDVRGSMPAADAGVRRRRRHARRGRHGHGPPALPRRA